MASTYTQLGIEKPADGEQSGTWGQTVNTNSELIEQAIGGYSEIDTSAGGTVSVTITDGALSDGRAAFLKLTGSPAAPFTFQLPEVEKGYTLWNTSGQTATVQTSTATATVSLVDGGIAAVVSDGAGTIVAPSAVGADTSLLNGPAKMTISLNQVGTQSIAYSYNVSSITDRGTGQTDVTPTNSFSTPDDWTAVGAQGSNTTIDVIVCGPSSGELFIRMREGASDTDVNRISAVAHGDLA